MAGSVSGADGAGAAQAMSGASASMPPASQYADVFSQIDKAGTGDITKDQFANEFENLRMPPNMRALGADAIFSKLDTNDTGNISQQDFISNMLNNVRNSGSNALPAASAIDFQNQLQNLNLSAGKIQPM